MTRTARMRGRLVATVAALLLAFGLVACGDDDSSNGEATGATGGTGGQAGGAESELCQELDNLESAVSDVRGLDSDSTVDEAKEAKDSVVNALTAVKDTAGAVLAAVVGAIETALDGLSTAVDNLQGDATIGEAATALANQSDVVGDAVDSLKSTADCN